MKHYIHVSFPVVLFLCGTWFSPCALSSAEEESRPVVVEWFTSQGCNSCPPAESVLAEIAKHENVILLAFHVDYWDYLGWHDSFELPEAATRQVGYQRSLHLSTLFTPQAIIDGRSSELATDRHALTKDIESRRDYVIHHSIPITLKIDHRMLTVSLPEQHDHSEFQIMFAAIQNMASTPVDKGENTGHTLSEFNIVRDFRILNKWDGRAAVFNASLDSIPTDADRIVVFIQAAHQGHIFGAAIQELSSR